MTVHFKEIKRTENKHRARRARSASPSRTMTLAGLRSNQLGISREPRFLSKKRTPFNPLQVSSWENSDVLQRQQDTTRARNPIAPTNNSENIQTPLGPRNPNLTKALRTSQPQLEFPSAHKPIPTGEQPTQELLTNVVNHALRKKAGLKSEQQKIDYQSSEYQRQFQWKTSASESPLLAAQQMLYNSNRSIPPFKSNPAVTESEYQRSFRGSPPPKAPQLCEDLKANELPPSQREKLSPEKSKKKKRNKQLFSRKSSPKEENFHQELEPSNQELSTSQVQKVARKVKTEYSTNFCSPLSYSYRDGAWVKSRTVEEEGHDWYHEVQELRRKAEAYRKRAWGTHFSRQHLSQILSEQNYLWEALSSYSPSSLTEEDAHATNSPITKTLDLASVKECCSPAASVPLATSRKCSAEELELSINPEPPVQTKLAWVEDPTICNSIDTKMKQQKEMAPVWQPKEREEEENKNGHSEEKNEEVKELEHELLSPTVKSESNSEEGRLPTPKLKTMMAAQRTHHDRTTPVTGGAILVSPPKVEDSKKSQRSEPSTGKVHSPFRCLGLVSPSDSKGVNGSSLLAAGMPTIDPLPLREDILSVDTSDPSSNPKTTRTPHKQVADAMSMDTNPRANKIQGTMRNPEFQHNGNLGSHRPDYFALPSSGCSVSDEDDKMSQISSWSAASCSISSQILERAQKRKKDFWEKS